MDSKDHLASEQLILLSSDDEADGDVVIDYLGSLNNQLLIPPLSPPVPSSTSGLLKCNNDPFNVSTTTGSAPSPRDVPPPLVLSPVVVNSNNHQHIGAVYNYNQNQYNNNNTSNHHQHLNNSSSGNSAADKCNNNSHNNNSYRGGKLNDIVIDTHGTYDLLGNAGGASYGVANNSNSVANHQQQQQQQQQHHLQQQHTTHTNMVPIISVTPHSPGAKFNFLEDTLNHLQCIRESVVQMKNSTIQNSNFGGAGFIGATQLSSSKLFSSCPSLPDLTISNPGSIWPHQQTMYGLNTDRRKSWTAIEDLTECAKSSHKSVSLSSLDSEEQESLRAAERLHNRTSRNSTGGISTHSLNEAELARDFEKIVAKRNLAPTVCRIPLQKSISTPSIAPVRSQGAKEDNATPSRHLSDSEDETHDDRSLLCVRDKNSEGYTDHPEKRRKRGSLFFRKKKDKAKTKGQNSTCDACGAVINLATYKEHAVECKAKIAKKYFQVQPKSGSNKKNTANSEKSGKKMTGCYSPWRLVANKLGVVSTHASHSSSHHDDQGRDYYDGNMHNDNSNYSDDTPLIRDEFLHETPIGPHDLGAEAILGVAIDEHDSWSPSVPKEIVKSLKDKQVKRQEHIYEFIMTEKHHCQTLLVMQKVFVESLQKHFNHLNLERMFPRLLDLTELHTGFLKKLRLKQRENAIVDSIADILLDFFSSMSAQKLKSAYGEFCSNHRSALGTFKCYMTGDNTFAEWYKHCQQNPLLKKKGIPECILFVTQRLTKYPLLIDPLLKSSREDKIEQEKLQKAMQLVKEILVDVDARVADKEKEDRQLEIFKRIDAKSYAIFKKDKFKKSDIISSNRKLKFEGVATLMQGRSKMQTVLVVVLSDCLFFLLENSHKYSFFTPENKAGVVSLQKLLIREKAGTESRGIYIISSNPAYPEMFELKVQNPKDKNVWIQSIRAAVLDCPSDESEVEDYMTVEQRQKLIDAKQANIREIICKMRQKDFEQAIILEEKIALQLSLLLDQEHNSEQLGPTVEAFLSNYGSYRDLISDDCDTIEIWKRVLNTIQEISNLAASLYTAATGLPLSRSCSSVGERQSEVFISPTLPKRAETFGGFDERRSKQQQSIANTSRDAVLSTLSAGYFTNRELYEKRESNASEFEGGPFSPGIQSGPLKQLNHPDGLTTEQAKDNNYAALHVSHHLHTLLCIISQQMTTIQHLQHQLNVFRENPKSIYRHNDQLEELRNLQDKLQEEKTAWQKQKESEERELEEQRQSQKTLQEQIRSEQEDIKQQREQLYRKMEILSSQGLLLSPSVALPVPGIPAQHETTEPAASSEEYHVDSGMGGQAGGGMATIDRRKDKWRTASINKAPPANLVSATNAPKIGVSSIKQQLPLKLSSLSSSKPSSNNNTVTSPPSGSSPSLTGGVSSGGGGAGITQMFPLKLADKKNHSSLPNHSRTGSSPAVIQQQMPVPSGNPATRTNTYPKIPERYRLRSSENYQSPQPAYATGAGTVPLASQSHPHSPSSPSPSHASSLRSATILEQQYQQQQHQLQQQSQQQQHHHQHHQLHQQQQYHGTPLSSRHSSLQSPPPGAGASPSSSSADAMSGVNNNNSSNNSPAGKKDASKGGKEEEVIYF
ncbi:rho guanine nucleotide exchange factor 18 isoform X2 [Uranotaenia lowii]|uniref:rho guanine nucleotide exchange factor 18 isoform X2 n=1 Tax=Uranotaenia lowii TaxID=190385 RepID=UPI0024783E61|nr:rho guanine nucleotide exchange factor 18 isoform X2 [Uranotaenia lowii]